jgi:hypothetical protein
MVVKDQGLKNGMKEWGGKNGKGKVKVGQEECGRKQRDA